MKFVTPFSDRVRPRIVIDPVEGRTKGSFKDECDVNKVVAKYLRTGQLPNLAKRDPRYGDFSDVPSFQEALERVALAEASFAALPAAVRAECHNDPAVFLERVADPDWARKHRLSLPPEAIPSSPGVQPGGPRNEPDEPPMASQSPAKAGGNKSGKDA